MTDSRCARCGSSRLAVLLRPEQEQPEAVLCLACGAEQDAVS